jgi:hypothetical protein
MKPAIQANVRVTFRPYQFNSDTWMIRVYHDDEAGPWIQWCDPVSRRCVTSTGIHSADGVLPVGWAGSRSQAEIGCEQLQGLYDTGQIR